MIHKYVLTFTVVILFLIQHTQGQQISGTWVGNYGRSFLTSRPQKLVVELSLSNDSVINGMSHLYYLNNKYEHYRISGIYHAADSSINFKEDSTIAVWLGLFSSNCLGNYTMKLSFTDTTMRWDGKWRDNDRFIFHCPSSSVYLEKRLPMNKAAEPPAKKDTVLSRASEVQNLVEYSKEEKDSVLVSIYDNGDIDGDSVSVYFDDRPVLSRVRISDKPLQFYVNLDPAVPTHKIFMAAESLGAIPPCTALLIIKTKKHRYEMNLSSNFSKNAVLEFFFKE
jgi:hypothetical protein